MFGSPFNHLATTGRSVDTEALLPEEAVLLTDRPVIKDFPDRDYGVSLLHYPGRSGRETRVHSGSYLSVHGVDGPHHKLDPKYVEGGGHRGDWSPNGGLYLVPREGTVSRGLWHPVVYKRVMHDVLEAPANQAVAVIAFHQSGMRLSEIQGVYGDVRDFMRRDLYRVPANFVADVLETMNLLSYGMMELLRDSGAEPQITPELLRERLPGMLPGLRQGVPDFVSADVGEDEHGPVIVIRTSRFLSAREKMIASHLTFEHPVRFEVRR